MQKSLVFVGKSKANNKQVGLVYLYASYHLFTTNYQRY